MSQTETRRYPRLDFSAPATLIIRPASGAKNRLNLPSHITSLSCEGAGLALAPRLSANFRRGQPCNLEFTLDGTELSIRSQVAWYAMSDSGGTVLGLRLLLALCPRVLRCTYSEWISAASIAGVSRGQAPGMSAERHPLG